MSRYFNPNFSRHGGGQQGRRGLVEGPDNHEVDAQRGAPGKTGKNIILLLTGQEVLTLLQVDSGKVEIVPLSSIKVLEKEFLTLPRQVSCSSS